MRPCNCERTPPKGEPYNPDYCRLCWLYHNDDRYRKLWDNSAAPQPALQAPSLARRAVNFARAILRHARAGLPVVSEEAAKRRIAICEGCKEWFDPQRRRCNRPECGCNMDEKVTWGEQHCPIEKW